MSMSTDHNSYTGIHVDMDLGDTVEQLIQVIEKQYPGAPSRDQIKVIFAGKLFRKEDRIKTMLRNRDLGDRQVVHFIAHGFTPPAPTTRKTLSTPTDASSNSSPSEHTPPTEVASCEEKQLADGTDGIGGTGGTGASAQGSGPVSEAAPSGEEVECSASTTTSQRMTMSAADATSAAILSSSSVSALPPAESPSGPSGYTHPQVRAGLGPKRAAVESAVESVDRVRVDRVRVDMCRTNSGSPLSEAHGRVDATTGT